MWKSVTRTSPSCRYSCCCQCFQRDRPERLTTKTKEPETEKMVMISFLRQKTILMMLLISCRAENVFSSTSNHQRVMEPEVITKLCPPCELFFTKLEKTGRDGKLTQDVRVQERGEPKSGTGLLFFWGSAALMRTCDYLQELYGEKTQG